MSVAMMGAGGIVNNRASLVPSMTSNSQNGYTVSASNYYNNDSSLYPIWHAFDGNTIRGGWAEQANGSTLYVGASDRNVDVDITFPKEVSVHAVKVIASTYEAGGVRQPASASLSYCNKSGSYISVNINQIAAGKSGTTDDSAGVEYPKSKKWRVTLVRLGEYIGLNQILLF